MVHSCRGRGGEDPAKRVDQKQAIPENKGLELSGTTVLPVSLAINYGAVSIFPL